MDFEKNMKNNFISWFCILLNIAVLSCEAPKKDPSEKNNQVEHIDSFESALPHGSSLGDTEMSDEDKLKLAEAVGKKAELIKLETLNQIIETDTSGWCLYQFWNLDCTNCLEINRYLNQLTRNQEFNSKLEIRYVNTKNLHPDQVNAYIRENEIVEEVYTISTTKLDDWATQIDQQWNGDLPALLLINNKDGSRLFYQQAFSMEELQAILGTLTL